MNKEESFPDRGWCLWYVLENDLVEEARCCCFLDHYGDPLLVTAGGLWYR